MRNSVTEDAMVITAILYHEYPFNTNEGGLYHTKQSVQ